MNKKLNNKAKKIFKIINQEMLELGKIQLLEIIQNYNFETNTLSTVGLEFAKKRDDIKKSKKIYFQLIDTSGQEKYKSLSSSYLKHADGVLFVFALNNKLSFE